MLEDQSAKAEERPLWGSRSSFSKSGAHSIQHMGPMQPRDTFGVVPGIPMMKERSTANAVIGEGRGEGLP